MQGYSNSTIAEGVPRVVRLLPIIAPPAGDIQRSSTSVAPTAPTQSPTNQPSAAIVAGATVTFGPFRGGGRASVERPYTVPTCLG